jgi:hypothetical protein
MAIVVLQKKHKGVIMRGTFLTTDFLTKIDQIFIKIPIFSTNFSQKSKILLKIEFVPKLNFFSKSNFSQKSNFVQKSNFISKSKILLLLLLSPQTGPKN